MGSKRKLAPTIINVIMNNHPKTKYLWDLFGGGGAVSFQALQHPQIEKVFYNELNTGVVSLLRKIQQDGVTPDFFEWIDRETFHELVNGNDWRAGLAKTCWSFGNNQHSYLFGKDIELIKKEAHDFLFAHGYDGTPETRIRLIKQFKQDKNLQGRFELQQLERLERLERLQQLQQLHISNLSYEDVKITTPPEETVIYLDPPYKNTEKYQCEIDYTALYNYFHNSPYTIYLSSYEFDGAVVAKMNHRCTLSPKSNNAVTEKLYCNKPVKSSEKQSILLDTFI